MRHTSAFHEHRFLPEQNPKATDAVLIVQGFNETLHKYVEVVHELYSAGFSVALYDHRGQVNDDSDDGLQE